MKTLGLIGGTSWVSTIQYYRRLNELALEATGGVHACKCFIKSLDIFDVIELQSTGQFEAMGQLISSSARELEMVGAEGILIGANTMHRYLPETEAAVSVPVLSIMDSVGETLGDHGYRRVGLLGTRPTMVEPFYAGRLSDFGIECLVPDPASVDEIHRLVVEELIQDRFLDATRVIFIREIEAFQARGAQAIIMGCTEIPLLLTQAQSPLPLIDTIEAHVRAGIRFAIS